MTAKEIGEQTGVHSERVKEICHDARARAMRMTPELPPVCVMWTPSLRPQRHLWVYPGDRVELAQEYATAVLNGILGDIASLAGFVEVVDSVKGPDALSVKTQAIADALRAVLALSHGDEEAAAHVLSLLETEYRRIADTFGVEDVA